MERLFILTFVFFLSCDSNIKKDNTSKNIHTTPLDKQVCYHPEKMEPTYYTEFDSLLNLEVLNTDNKINTDNIYRFWINEDCSAANFMIEFINDKNGYKIKTIEFLSDCKIPIKAKKIRKITIKDCDTVQWKLLNKYIDSALFWGLTSLSNYSRGFDGRYIVMEGWRNTKYLSKGSLTYNEILLWSPDGDFGKLMDYVLKTASVSDEDLSRYRADLNQ